MSRDDDHADLVDDDGLDEYRALVARVDDAVAKATVRAGDQITCRAGCAACCVDGLSVLPVEAFAIAAHVDRIVGDGAARPARRATADACVFLDDGGRCSVYAARPILCRTHGLPLATGLPDAPARGALPVLDDLSVCGLNFTTRPPTRADALDADRLMQVLVVVDRRFRARAGLDDDDARVALRALAADLDADDPGDAVSDDDDAPAA